MKIRTTILPHTSEYKHK